MGDVQLNVSMPLDDEGYFRRECPLCMKEFKVLLTKEELSDFEQKSMDSFMLEKDASNENEEGLKDESNSEHHCPYCGQAAAKKSWWTKEQLDYVKVYAENIIAKIVNESLIQPLKKLGSQSASGFVTVKVESKELPQKEPWISPENNDMQVFDLPCCQRKIKIDDTVKQIVYCFFCGFPHKIS